MKLRALVDAINACEVDASRMIQMSIDEKISNARKRRDRLVELKAPQGVIAEMNEAIRGMETDLDYAVGCEAVETHIIQFTRENGVRVNAVLLGKDIKAIPSSDSGVVGSGFRRAVSDAIMKVAYGVVEKIVQSPEAEPEPDEDPIFREFERKQDLVAHQFMRMISRT